MHSFKKDHNEVGTSIKIKTEPGLGSNGTENSSSKYAIALESSSSDSEDNSLNERSNDSDIDNDDEHDRSTINIEDEKFINYTGNDSDNNEMDEKNGDVDVNEAPRDDESEKQSDRDVDCFSDVFDSIFTEECDNIQNDQLGEDDDKNKKKNKKIENNQKNEKNEMVVRKEDGVNNKYHSNRSGVTAEGEFFRFHECQ